MGCIGTSGPTAVETGREALKVYGRKGVGPLVSCNFTMYIPRRLEGAVRRANATSGNPLKRRRISRYCKKMKNVTVSVSDEVYHRARIRAALMNTSVSGPRPARRWRPPVQRKPAALSRRGTRALGCTQVLTEDLNDG